jgi:hypothetical protein
MWDKWMSTSAHFMSGGFNRRPIMYAAVEPQEEPRNPQVIFTMHRNWWLRMKS